MLILHLQKCLYSCTVLSCLCWDSFQANLKSQCAAFTGKAGLCFSCSSSAFIGCELRIPITMSLRPGCSILSTSSTLCYKAWHFSWGRISALCVASWFSCEIHIVLLLLVHVQLLSLPWHTAVHGMRDNKANQYINGDFQGCSSVYVIPGPMFDCPIKILKERHTGFLHSLKLIQSCLASCLITFSCLLCMMDA